MVTVKELMNTDIYSIRAREKVRDLLNIFVDKQVSGVPVVDDDNILVGIITDADILAEIREVPSLIDVMTYVIVLNAEAIFLEKLYALLERPVHELMTKKVVSVTENATISDVAQILIRRKFKKLPVVKGKKLIGVVSRGDVVRYMVREFLSKNKAGI